MIVVCGKNLEMVDAIKKLFSRSLCFDYQDDKCNTGKTVDMSILNPINPSIITSCKKIVFNHKKLLFSESEHFPKLKIYHNYLSQQ